MIKLPRFKTFLGRRFSPERGRPIAANSRKRKEEQKERRRTTHHDGQMRSDIWAHDTHVLHSALFGL